MAKLTDDEQKLLEDLTKKAQEEDPDEKFEIEIYDTNQGRGARVPYSHGKKWLYDNFGLGENPNPSKEGEGEGDGKDKTVKVGYFGRLSQQQKQQSQSSGKAS
jgi:hypothetical protein